MKKFVFSAAIILTLVLAGCGDSSKENVDGTVNKETTKDESKSNENKGSEETKG